MMALQTGLRLPEAPAAIVGFSGHLAGAKRLAAEIKVKPPVLLIHGSADEVIPVAAIHLARAGLAAAGVPVQWQIRPGLAHGIDPEGLRRLEPFCARPSALTEQGPKLGPNQSPSDGEI